MTATTVESTERERRPSAQQLPLVTGEPLYLQLESGIPQGSRAREPTLGDQAAVTLPASRGGQVWLVGLHHSGVGKLRSAGLDGETVTRGQDQHEKQQWRRTTLHDDPLPDS